LNKNYNLLYYFFLVLRTLRKEFQIHSEKLFNSDAAIKITLCFETLVKFFVGWEVGLGSLPGEKIEKIARKVGESNGIQMKTVKKQKIF
jgi:hypothetical protein